MREEPKEHNIIGDRTEPFSGYEGVFGWQMGTAQTQFIVRVEPLKLKNK